MGREASDKADGAKLGMRGETAVSRYANARRSHPTSSGLATVFRFWTELWVRWTEFLGQELQILKARKERRELLWKSAFWQPPSQFGVQKERIQRQGRRPPPC